MGSGGEQWEAVGSSRKRWEAVGSGGKQWGAVGRSRKRWEVTHAVVRVQSIYGGSNEIMKELIGRSITKE